MGSRYRPSLSLISKTFHIKMHVAWKHAEVRKDTSIQTSESLRTEETATVEAGTKLNGVATAIISIGRGADRRGMPGLRQISSSLIQ